MTPAVGNVDQDFRGNSELFVQASNHFQGEGTIASHHFINPRSVADNADQRAVILALLIEPESDRVQGIRGVDGVMGSLIGFGKCDQYVEEISLGGALGRSPQPLNGFQSFLVILLCLNWFQVHISRFSRRFCRIRHECPAT